MQQLLEFTQILTSKLEIDEILQLLITFLSDFTKFNKISFVLIDEKVENEAWVIALNIKNEMFKQKINLSKYPEVEAVIQSQEPLVISDIQSSPIMEKVKLVVLEKQIKMALILPLIFEESIMGVLFLRSTIEGKEFEPEELETLQVMANATAIALKNARYVQELARKSKIMTIKMKSHERKIKFLEKYEEFFDNAPFGMIILSADSIILFMNLEAERICGKRDRELTNCPVTQVIHAQSEALFREILSSAQKGLFSSSQDIAFRTVGQNPVVVSLSARRSDPGSDQFIISFIDVTQARQMESELKKTKEFLEKTITNSVDAIIGADLKGIIILFNQSAERIFGYTAEEVIGKKNVLEMYPHREIPHEIMKMLRSEGYGGVGRLSPIHREILTKNGERIPIRMTASILYENKREMASVGIFTDLREWIKMQQQLSKTQEKLLESEKAALIGELAGAAAHELNQPLTSIMGTCELLQKKRDFESPYVDILYQECQRIAEIVKKIGNITRYESKSYLGKSRIVDIDQSHK